MKSGALIKMNNPDRINVVDNDGSNLLLISDNLAKRLSANFLFERRRKNLDSARGVIWGFTLSVSMWAIIGIILVIFLKH
jgi:hypothetical protein